jgi:hypothetical protein
MESQAYVTTFDSSIGSDFFRELQGLNFTRRL